MAVLYIINEYKYWKPWLIKNISKAAARSRMCPCEVVMELRKSVNNTKMDFKEVNFFTWIIQDWWMFVVVKFIIGELATCSSFEVLIF